MTVAATAGTSPAVTSDRPVCRSTRSRSSARRCDAAASHSRVSTSRYKIAENTAITLTSEVGPLGTVMSSTTGAISDASMSRASLLGETSPCCLGTGSVSVAMVGCSEAAPQAV